MRHLHQPFPGFHRTTLGRCGSGRRCQPSDVFYLAVGGADTNSGTRDQPLATFEGSADAARKAATGLRPLSCCPASTS